MYVGLQQANYLRSVTLILLYFYCNVFESSGAKTTNETTYGIYVSTQCFSPLDAKPV